MNPFLSIIIPAFNEETRIGATLDAVNKYMKEQKYDYEILVVDDGSTDGTATLVQEKAKTIPHILFFKEKKNTGKGNAVKKGMLNAVGDIRLFMDADNSTSIDQIEKLLPHFNQGHQIVIGSRRVKGARVVVKQNLFREISGAIFRTVAHTLLPLCVKDTQNGFKAFSKDTATEIFSESTIKGWSFDVEIILLAQKKGYSIKEVPIIWINDKRSTVRLTQMFRMLTDLVKLRIQNLYR
jgi:dolichyl-phosphate beta-glucosyltransferase